MANKNVIADCNFRANKTVGLNPHPVAQCRAALDFHERADTASVSDFASVQVCVSVNDDIATKDNVVGNGAIGA